jgi:hypothetical protein
MDLAGVVGKSPQAAGLQLSILYGLTMKNANKKGISISLSFLGRSYTLSMASIDRSKTQNKD